MEMGPFVEKLERLYKDRGGEFILVSTLAFLLV
jgi:hypothetical protein